MPAETRKIGDKDLVLTRVYDAPPEKLFQAWTDPELMKQWFVPRPWTIARVESDIRPGGASIVVMRDPDGKEYPNPGQYLEVVPNRKLVFTDAYLGDWKHSEKPFMTVVLTFEPIAGGKTNYTAYVSHWTKEDCETHEQMGFHQGWAQVAEQLAEIVEKK
ncbi:MAG: SRPBCC family protein [Hyphomonadaceae bacterium]|nr:SRPBCC family protein [Hyphomonadaceae bacterium]